MQGPVMNLVYTAQVNKEPALPRDIYINTTSSLLSQSAMGVPPKSRVIQTGQRHDGIAGRALREEPLS